MNFQGNKAKNRQRNDVFFAGSLPIFFLELIKMNKMQIIVIARYY